MNGKILLAVLASTALTACMPAKEISETNAEEILRAAVYSQQVASALEGGFQPSVRVQNQTLTPYLLPQTRTTVETCHNDQGSLLLSQSKTKGSFSLVFEDCHSNHGGVVNGALSGAYNESSRGKNIAYSSSVTDINIALNGDFSVRHPNYNMRLNPYQLHATLQFNGTELSRFFTHNGTLTLNSSDFQGKIRVTTITPIGFNARTLKFMGEINYRDSDGNVLTQKHDNNGVHISLNGNALNSYSHEQWSNYVKHAPLPQVK